jgi:hypothetical protein
METGIFPIWKKLVDFTSEQTGHFIVLVDILFSDLKNLDFHAVA